MTLGNQLEMVLVLRAVNGVLGTQLQSGRVSASAAFGEDSLFQINYFFLRNYFERQKNRHTCGGALIFQLDACSSWASSVLNWADAGTRDWSFRWEAGQNH